MTDDDESTIGQSRVEIVESSIAPLGDRQSQARQRSKVKSLEVELADLRARLADANETIRQLKGQNSTLVARDQQLEK
jgi:hypothetical protein